MTGARLIANEDWHLVNLFEVVEAVGFGDVCWAPEEVETSAALAVSAKLLSGQCNAHRGRSNHTARRSGAPNRASIFSGIGAQKGFHCGSKTFLVLFRATTAANSQNLPAHVTARDQARQVFRHYVGVFSYEASSLDLHFEITAQFLKDALWSQFVEAVSQFRKSFRLHTDDTLQAHLLVRAFDAQDAVAEFHQRFVNWSIDGESREELLKDRFRALLENGDEQVVFGRKTAIEGRLGTICPPRDFVGAGPLKSMLDENLSGDIQKFSDPFFIEPEFACLAAVGIWFRRVHRPVLRQPAIFLNLPFEGRISL